jgi:predicted transcriptional regulator
MVARRMGDSVSSRELFLQEKPAGILLAMRESEGSAYIAKLAEATRCTYAHAFRVIEKLEMLGLVSSSEQGRLRMIKLTDLGKAVADELFKLSSLMALVEASNAIDRLYDAEIRGKLREEIDKEKFLGKAEELAAALEEILKKAPTEFHGLVKKEMKRLEELKLEVKGIVVGSPSDGGMSAQR